MGRWPIVNALLAIMVALLGFQIVRTWARGLPPVEAAPSAPPPPDAAPPHEKGKRGAGDKAAARGQQTPPMLVAAIVEKDLFDPSRRAPSPEETKVDTTPITKPPDNVVVVGVRILGKDREAFVNDGTQNPAIGRRLRTGDTVAGYTMKKIEATGVVLSSPSGDLVAMPLSLDKGKAAATPPRAPTPGRAPQPTPVPPRPGQVPQPAAASPAMGPRGASPAAGVVVAPPPTPPPPAVPVPAVPQPGM